MPVTTLYCIKTCAAPEGKCMWVTAPSAALYHPSKATFFLSSPDIQLLDISQLILCSSSSFGRIFAEHLACQREWKKYTLPRFLLVILPSGDSMNEGNAHLLATGHIMRPFLFSLLSPYFANSH